MIGADFSLTIPAPLLPFDALGSSEVEDMTFRIALTALSLSLAPFAAVAECSGHEQKVQSCAPGSAWDAENKSCVKQITS
ncbi:hypothetical protein [Seohaeicola zhoushanensis]|nr:hypothetical protein [Seohaeicola zhoushanensis]